MLPKSKRLNLKVSFKWVAAGKRVSSDYFTLFYRLAESPTPLVGISVSSKSLKKATERNRARRLLATAIQVHYPRLIERLNVVIMPKPEILKVSSQVVDDQLEQVLKDAQLIN